MRGDLADQRDVFFFYLAVISYANSTCKVKTGEDVDDSSLLADVLWGSVTNEPQGTSAGRLRRLVAPKFLSPRELCPVLSSRPSPTSVYWLETWVFLFSQAIVLG